MKKGKKYWKLVTSGTVFIVLGVIFYFSLPDPLFDDPYSTVLEDRNANLLSAAIATDGQWRFPEQLSVPEKFKQAITLFEDKRFFSHPGVDLLATARALRQNVGAGRIVSGGSTISMQVVRLFRKNHSRTFLEKVIEAVLALRLELKYSKEEILSIYAAHAPFGGNVVGIEAASWRYFGRRLDQLSWAEAALLAVLPNNPSLIHPGRNRDVLKEKRDRLLDRLLLEGKMDELTLDLAKAEPIPEQPLPLPQHSTHLLVRAMQEGNWQKRVSSTLDESIQIRAEQIVNDHFRRISGNQIFNAAAIIVKVESGEVLAYVGNVNSGSEHGDKVDLVNARRSTGSILKPFLYAAMLDDGKMLPHTLVPDVPTVISGFSPKNFSLEYDGAVPADKALIRSLNIPAVRELQEYRYEKFYELLRNVGITTLTREPDHYGFSLILGGAEGTLWDITGAYASMSRTLNNFFQYPGSKRYHANDFHPPNYLKSSITPDSSNEELRATNWLSAASIWITLETLTDVYRPGEQTGWQHFNSSKTIAWKTGTSFGFRDGWAVGTNPDYAVGVWVGNADGEGRPGLTGTEMAAPVMFDLFNLLPGQSWFETPEVELIEITTCAQSGQRLSEFCTTQKLVRVPRRGLETGSCSYHKRIHLTKDRKYLVNLDCESAEKIVAENWFALPPVQEYYYRTKNLSYTSLPPTRSDCPSSATLSLMDLVYPAPGAAIFVPRELDGAPGRAVFQAAHRSSKSVIYWHLDGNFIGTTTKNHQLSLSAAFGPHTVTLVDGDGEMLTQSFNILSSP